MINWRTLGYGATLAGIDVISLPIVKAVSQGWDPAWMILPILIYAFDPIILLHALESETLTIMNLVWDLSSDLLVTLVGLFVFAERLPPTKMLGVFVSFIGLFLMSYEGDGWNEYLTRNYRAAVSGINTALGRN